MKIFKIDKTYVMGAPDQETAKQMVKAMSNGELYLVAETVRELPKLAGANRWTTAWFAELKRQLAG